MALPSSYSPPLIDQLFSGKIRLKLLARLFLKPGSKVYLRQLERDLQVSSNTVRLELNKLSEMKLINVVEAEESKIKKYIAFYSLIGMGTVLTYEASLEFEFYHPSKSRIEEAAKMGVKFDQRKRVEVIIQRFPILTKC